MARGEVAVGGGILILLGLSVAALLVVIAALALTLGYKWTVTVAETVSMIAANDSSAGDLVETVAEESESWYPVVARAAVAGVVIGGGLILLGVSILVTRRRGVEF